jgi:hypothetical protein
LQLEQTNILQKVTKWPVRSWVRKGLPAGPQSNLQLVGTTFLLLTSSQCPALSQTKRNTRYKVVSWDEVSGLDMHGNSWSAVPVPDATVKPLRAWALEPASLGHPVSVWPRKSLCLFTSLKIEPLEALRESMHVKGLHECLCHTLYDKGWKFAQSCQSVLMIKITSEVVRVTNRVCNT